MIIILKLLKLMSMKNKFSYQSLQETIFQPKTYIKKLILIILGVLMLFPSCLFSQKNKEALILQEIENIDQSMNRFLGVSQLRPFLKKYKKVARKNRRDSQLSAVTNAVIGKNLSQKGFHDAATKFLKKAYQYRKKQNLFAPQRWALNALIKNGEAKDDYDFLFKYAKEWIDLSFQNRDQLNKFYDYEWEGINYFSIEREILLRKIYPEVWSRTRKNYRSWDKRREFSQALLEYYLIQFPKEKEPILEEANHFYQTVFSDKGEDEIEEMLFWKKVSTQTMKQYASPTTYAKHLRYLATLFRKRNKRFAKGMKTDKYEKIGIELIQEYIDINKNQKEYANVLFGTRYLATRYAVLKDYKKAVQYLATAIKLCRKFEMESEIVKSIGGLHTMLYPIKKAKDQLGLQAAQHWKNNFDLNGLLEEDVKRIDNILK